MTVINIHKRVIHQPVEKVIQLFKTLAKSKDLIWPYEKWPAMKFKDGLKVGSKGGHGRVRYAIIEFKEGEHIKFQFTEPEGFIGIHQLKVEEIAIDKTEISHEIRMNTTFKATFLWLFIVRWLHDALIENAFNKVENHFDNYQRKSTYNFWVQYLREAYKRKSFQTKHA